MRANTNSRVIFSPHLRSAASGTATKSVAAELRVSVKTVESYRGKIKDKLGLRTGHELQRQALYYVTGGKMRGE